MSDVRSLSDSGIHAATAILERLVSYLPSFAAAIVLVFVGWVVAKTMRALAIRTALLIDTVLPRLGLPAGLSRFRVARGSVVVGTVVYWLVLLFFVTTATQVLGLQAFTDWLSKLIDYLPTLIVGLLILTAGWLMSGFAAELMQATVTGLEPGQSAMLERVVRISILVGAILVGADQIGIRITFLAIFIGAIAITVGGGLALAVGFGARGHVANLIAAHHLRQAFTVGQTLQFAGHEGRLLEITATNLIIETADGRVMLPASLFNEHPLTVKTRGSNG
ncbi:MAG: mechanosensitive ion channel [Propionivibrio sp.]|jgi:small-conductance mechanosensitive channel|nr:mechanosensitive ion channel [Propionivibrio sp.]MBK7565134.1 mechanosensitive ion channel [Propionivibrio sp.]MBK9028664.1 mechanosensitive ion channel [Propionivibrio sp.]